MLRAGVRGTLPPSIGAYFVQGTLRAGPDPWSPLPPPPHPPRFMPLDNGDIAPGVLRQKHSQPSIFEGGGDG